MLTAVISAITVTGLGCSTSGGSMEGANGAYSDAAISSQVSASESFKSELYLLRRSLKKMEDHIAGLKLKKELLQRQLTGIEFQKDALVGTPQKAEVSRIGEFLAATVASQTRIAETSARFEAVSADADIAYESEISDIDATADAEIAQIRATASKSKSVAKIKRRRLVALARTGNYVESAKITMPVVTNTGVYSDLIKDTPVADANTAAMVLSLNEQASQKLSAPVVSRPINHGASLRNVSMHRPAQVVAKPKRTTYDVVYVYSSRRSWEHFTRVLEGYGVKDMWAMPNSIDNEYYIYVGRYNKPKQATRRKAYLDNLVSTNHAEVRKQVIF